MKIELKLDLQQIDYVEDALVQYIDYLRYGDKDEKAKAKRVEKTYDEIRKQKYSRANYESDI